MDCSKYTLTNTGATSINFNYRRCDDSMWEYQVNLNPNETKNIWLIDGTYDAAQIFEQNIVLVDNGAFPPPSIPVATFTISSSDFTNGNAIYQDTTPIGVDGVDGFTNTAPQGNLAEGYYGQGLTPNAVSRISSAVTEAGLDPNNSTGYVWRVSWGAGSTVSTGYVKFGYYGSPSEYFDIQTIDPTDTDWQLSGNTNGTSLVGTFLFPATFSIYTPLTNKGGWC
jgi:hypothetical protein